MNPLLLHVFSPLFGVHTATMIRIVVVMITMVERPLFLSFGGEGHCTSNDWSMRSRKERGKLVMTMKGWNTDQYYPEEYKDCLYLVVLIMIGTSLFLMPHHYGSPILFYINLIIMSSLVRCQCKSISWSYTLCLYMRHFWEQWWYTFVVILSALSHIAT